MRLKRPIPAFIINFQNVHMCIYERLNIQMCQRERVYTYVCVYCVSVACVMERDRKMAVDVVDSGQGYAKLDKSGLGFS